MIDRMLKDGVEVQWVAEHRAGKFCLYFCLRRKGEGDTKGTCLSPPNCLRKLLSSVPAVFTGPAAALAAM